MEPTQRTPTTQSPDLETILADVLGELAFIVRDDETLELTTEGLWLHCTIAYRGPLGGTLECWCTRAFATQLSANLLGLEPADDEARISAVDAVREFMNVLCGQVITAWHGKNRVFDLTIPEVQECIAAPVPTAQKQDRWCRLSVEGEPFVCTYRRDG